MGKFVGQNCIKFVVTREALPSMAALEVNINYVKSRYEASFGYTVNEVFIGKVTIKFVATRVAPLSMAAFEVSSNEVKSSYEDGRQVRSHS